MLQHGFTFSRTLAATFVFTTTLGNLLARAKFLSSSQVIARFLGEGLGTGDHRVEFTVHQRSLILGAQLVRRNACALETRFGLVGDCGFELLSERNE